MSHENKNNPMTLVINEQSKYLNRSTLMARSITNIPLIINHNGIELFTGHSSL